MTIDHISKYWATGSFPSVSAWNSQKPQAALFSGVAGSADAFLISDIYSTSKRTVFVCVENSKRAETLAAECSAIAGDDAVLLFPSRDAVPYNMKSPFGPVVENRFRVMSRLLSGKPGIFIAPYPALLQRLPPPRELFNKIIRLAVSQEIEIETLAQWLVDANFRRETIVQDVGTFGIRGGIVDIYPFMTDGPIRLEFFGDTIESIREFDVFSQKSAAKRQSVEIFPMKEYCLGTEDIERGLESLAKCASDDSTLASGVQKLSHQWRSLADHDGIEWFFHHFGMKQVGIAEYLPSNAVLVWDDIMTLDRRFDECVLNYTRHLERVPDAFLPLVSQPTDLLISKDDAEAALSLFTTAYIGTVGAPANIPDFECMAVEQPPLSQSVDILSAELAKYDAMGYETIVVCGNVGYGERLLELIGEACPFLRVFTGFLSHGFIDKVNKRLVFSDAQIFDRLPTRQVAPRKQKTTAILSLDTLSPGDFVVHIDHGIGRFVGIERIETDGLGRDCMVILYQGSSKLSVPVEDFHKVQKYIGKESVAPPLSRLGSGAWEKTKAKTRESLKDMAQELIALYAKRQFFDGIAFAPDTLWQKEFEDSFVYEATADQLKAVAEVKKDMESTKPMDRLVCGDVGFGKTEVAMRAAFKAVMDGHQVAVLSPTTVLTAQHFATFSARMANFPVRIAMLSRFLSHKEEKDVVKRVSEGNVDILIGTHRMLSADVVFKKLGLLIIDEEQRFGVKHKEALKQFRSKIDVLSMTATPIPRTLHLSLVGARDLSIINTPPRNRLPVETQISEYHDDVLKKAIEQELERGGQVFVVNNRIQTLDAIRGKIEALVPRARVVCAHGQMDEEDELARIMREFVAGRYDVLVSTTIIENGIDIPNVNTILVIRADTMGLSQLYQLRGRVGRSTDQAYAYLLTSAHGEVQELALKRLRVLEQYTDLGSGFQIAMRDLEIRGAGNILGASQHGFIAAVGFELYCRLLEEEVRDLKGEAVVKEPELETAVDIPAAAFIPNEYVADGGARVSIYQELSSAKNLQDVDTVERDLADRFGAMPQSVSSLLLLMRVKVLARNLGCARVSVNDSGLLTLTFAGDDAAVNGHIRSILSKSERNFEAISGPPASLRTRLSAHSAIDRALEAKEILSKLI